ncbi:MAG: metallo-hydrolase family protein [Candidatus Saccharibacteria bacterium]|nr:metallo-hydrolase family protein [Candidatus Saccharibacteria bacterium]
MRRTSPTLTNYAYYSPRQSKQQPVPSWKATLGWLVAHRSLFLSKPARFIVVSALITAGVHGGWTKHVAAQAAAQKQADHAALLAAQQKSQQFGAQVQQLIAANPGVDVGVSVATSRLGLQNFGSTKLFDAASTGKLLTAVTYLNMVEHHRASLSDDVAGKSAQQALDTMIIKSDDQSWGAFNTMIGHTALSAQATTLGITDYNADTNSLSAQDIALLLSKLADGTLLTPQHRQLLLSEMARANFRDYIVPAVASPNLVYHKVGIDEDNVHDAAIIKHGDQWLTLVIYTNGNGQYNWVQRAQLMQQITQAAQTAYL